MKIRKTFLISWLVSTGEKQNETSVIDIEYVQTGDHARVPTLEEANEWMRKTGDPRESVQFREAN